MHEILNYLTWLNEIVKPYRDLIDVVSASVIAVFTIVLARVGWKQTKITRILQRAYLDAKFGGIKNNRAGELVGYVIFRNVGHLPAQKLSSLVILSTGGRDWKPPKTNRKDLGGKSVIPDRRGVANGQHRHFPPSDGRERIISLRLGPRHLQGWL